MSLQPASSSSMLTRYAWADSYVLCVFESAPNFGLLVLAAVKNGIPRNGEAYEYETALILGTSRVLSWTKRDMRVVLDADGSVDFGGVEELAEFEASFHFRGECGEFRAELTAPMEYYVVK